MSYIDNSAAASDPVGIVTIWLTSTPPTNWLILDGSSFSGTDYPELEALLGGTTLPDFRNIFPLGAGTKNSWLYWWNFGPYSYGRSTKHY